ncbi:MAG: penicillin-binding protein [Fibrobacter sp.]|nr:penicillin-binding protein [Fibrobacter sp.]
MKYYYDPKNRRPYKERMRNRCIAAAVFIIFCTLIGSCIFGGESDTQAPVASTAVSTSLPTADSAESAPVDSAEKPVNALQASAPLTKAEDQVENIANTQATIIAAVTPETQPEIEVIDSAHIKNQKDVFLAEKIDIMLRRFKPLHSVILVVEPKTNEIIAWGETKDGKVQNDPDYFVKNTFPAASLAKTITIAAAMESNRYSLNTPIPDQGAHHTLYKRQLRVAENYTGPTIELQDAYAKSANPPLAIIGMNVGASRLKSAAKNLGYNMNFPSGIPGRSSYNPPDTGYGLAEASCGFTESTTLTPLLAAAQVRSILTKKPLEIPWAANLPQFAPKNRIALDVGKFSENTYYGLREAMIRSITNGTARKHISTRNMARKNFNALNIGGKTGSLDGHDPYGRYEWFMGFAQAKEDPSKAIVVVILQIHDLQGFRSQPACQVAAMIINYWAHKTLWSN